MGQSDLLQLSREHVEVCFHNPVKDLNAIKTLNQVINIRLLLFNVKILFKLDVSTNTPYYERY